MVEVEVEELGCIRPIGTFPAGKMRGTESKKLALRARGLGKNLATGMVSVGISVFAPRIAPFLGIGAILADNDGAPKRALFWGVRLIILRMGKTPPGFLLNVVDGGGDEHTSAREPLPLPVDAISVALRPFGNSSAVMLGKGRGGRKRGWLR